MSSAKVVIVGAGVSGLIAAQHLEAAGLHPIIIEATDRVGGRVKTDLIDGFTCDHGFQVLLTAYREAQHYLSYSQLGLSTFRPGAVVYKNAHATNLVDPLREPSQLFNMLFASVASFKDKLLTWKLQRELRQSAPADLFAKAQQMTSLQFLRSYGFSQKYIEAFFQPFFGGIFLENALDTPAAMLRFVFKMFAEGQAAVPKGGMGEIPKMLHQRLQHTEVHFNTKTEAVIGSKIRTDAGEDIPFDALIIATDPQHLMPQLAGEPIHYHGTSTFYFRSNERVLPKRLIGLAADATTAVNNFCEMEALDAGYTPAGEELVSVTLKDIPTEKHPEEKIAQELRQITGKEQWQLTPIARYDIPLALPNLGYLTYDYTATQSRVTEQIFLAGDHLLFGSLDAAMRSGRRAAEGVLERFNLYYAEK